MRFRLNHPVDRRLHATYGDEGKGFFVELFFVGDSQDEPTVRFGGADGEPWSVRRPLFFEAVDVLVLNAFITVSEVHDAMDLLDRGVPVARMSRRLRVVAELVANLREVCGA